MSRLELIIKSGRLFIAAAVAFVTILTGTDPIAIPGSVVAAILLAMAMSSLRSAYRESISPLGRNMLLLGMLGPVLWVVAMAFLAITAERIPMEQGLWVLIFVGPAISLLGLTMFGLSVLRSKPMPRLNWLPFFAGIWYPMTYAVFSVYVISHKGVVPDQFVPALLLMLALMVVVQFIALCFFGIILITDSPKQPTTDNDAP